MMQFGRRGLEKLKTLRQRDFSGDTDVKGCIDMGKKRGKQAQNQEDKITINFFESNLKDTL